MKKNLGFVVYLLLLTSCSVEKINLSPLSSSFASYNSTSSTINNTTQSLNNVNYASEITNTLAEFPTFSSQKLNSEIHKMKLHISDYIFALKQNDNSEKNKAYKNYTTCYKSIQNLKSNLSSEELELLNRYLVKIKTNISLIDSINTIETK